MLLFPHSAVSKLEGGASCNPLEVPKEGPPREIMGLHPIAMKKFRKIGIEIFGFDLYVDADCTKINAIKQKIINMNNALKKQAGEERTANLINDLFRK